MSQQEILKNDEIEVNNGYSNFFTTPQYRNVDKRRTEIMRSTVMQFCTTILYQLPADNYSICIMDREDRANLNFDMTVPWMEALGIYAAVNSFLFARESELAKIMMHLQLLWSCAEMPGVQKIIDYLYGYKNVHICKYDSNYSTDSNKLIVVWWVEIRDVGNYLGVFLDGKSRHGFKKIPLDSDMDIEAMYYETCAIYLGKDWVSHNGDLNRYPELNNLANIQELINTKHFDFF